MMMPSAMMKPANPSQKISQNTASISWPKVDISGGNQFDIPQLLHDAG